MEITPNTYLEFVRKYVHLCDDDALLWLLAYCIYVHAIDDIVDGDIPKEMHRIQFMLQQFEFAETVYTNKFYLNNIHKLRPLIKMASNAYMDSVILEKCVDKVGRGIADSLRCLGNEVILAVIEIQGGIEKRREASIHLREISWITHHLEDGTPI